MLITVQLLILTRVMLGSKKATCARQYIAEKKSNHGKMNSEELRTIYIKLTEDEKEQTSLILNSKTTLRFREIVAFGVVSTPLLNSVCTSSISDYSLPANNDTPAESFDNYDHEMLCLLQDLPMNNSTPEQADIWADILIDRYVKNQSVSGKDYNVSINSRNISTKGISGADVTITDEGRLRGLFVRKLFLILVIKYIPKQKLKF